MTQVNIHEAKTHLSRLIEAVLRGETVVIARSGKPLVKVVPVDAPDAPVRRRLGFMPGAFDVPDDFDQMGEEHIEQMFGVAE